MNADIFQSPYQKYSHNTQLSISTDLPLIKSTAISFNLNLFNVLLYRLHQSHLNKLQMLFIINSLYAFGYTLSLFISNQIIYYFYQLQLIIIWINSNCTPQIKSMNSSNSEAYSYQKQPRMLINSNFKNKKMKDYICPCGRSYGSYPALYSHIKRKHDGKAPGEVIKPKPLRRRGRPFKYEPAKLQNPNSHKNASRHLEQYLKSVQKDESSQFPLKQFAQQDRLRVQFMDVGVDEQKLRRFQNQQLRRHNGDIHGLNQLNLKEGLNFPEKERMFPVSHNHSQEQNGFGYNLERINQRQKEIYRTSIQQYDDRIPELILNGQMQSGRLMDIQNYNQFLSQRASFISSIQSHRHPSYDNFRYSNDQVRPNAHSRPDYNVFQSIYSKPFEMALNEQMEEKFGPIAQGITDFLEPILKQMINNEEMESPQKVVNIDEGDQDNDEIVQVGNNEHHKNQGKVDIQADFKNKQNNMGEMMPQSKQRAGQDLKRNDLLIEELLQNQHFRDILRWVMSPPEEGSSRLKENYIEFSFRCCLVQFLDFLNNFLQTAQYKQVLLVVVFFCDHILAVTGSFESRPQPQVYEMSLYFNSFMHQYLPKLMNYLPVLSNFYMFVDFKKKTSELLMWLSSWQAMQQYHHNRYYREKMAFEISQQNYKAILYQKKYQAYITEALNQNLSLQTIRRPLPYTQNQQVEQKTEENPELIVFTQQHDPVNGLNIQSRVYSYNNSSHDQNQPSSNSELNSQHIEHEEFLHLQNHEQHQSSQNSLHHSSKNQSHPSQIKHQQLLNQKQFQRHPEQDNSKPIHLSNLKSTQIQQQQQLILNTYPINQSTSHHHLQQEELHLRTNNINQTPN